MESLVSNRALGYSKKSDLKMSSRLQKAASKLMPSGATDKIFINNAHGSHVWDVDENEYIDYKLGYGPVILGHSHPEIQKRVHEYDQRGVIYGSDHPLEIEVAKKIRSLMPSAEMIRYFVTGTEATMNAIKIARAYTGKERIIKFEGHYHGFHDYVSFSTEPKPKSKKGVPQPDVRGIPRTLQKLVIVKEWNDFDAVEKAVKKSAGIAAIITEPVMANSSLIPPQNGYLKFLKELCDKNGIVLIFDEVKTGFRVAKGGAQELYSVRPHLTALAKSFGNGYPISAVAGMKEIMDKHASREILPQGTYARNPVSLAAADATMDAMLGSAHSRIEKFGSALVKGLQDILADKNLDAIVQGYPSAFQVLFTKQEQVRTYREFSRCDQDKFGRFQHRLLKKGIMLDENNSEPFYTSAAHDNNDLEKTLEAIEASLQAIK